MKGNVQMKAVGLLLILSFLGLGATCGEEDDAAGEDAGPVDTAEEDGNENDTGEEEASCLEISDDEECETQDHCAVFKAYEVDTEAVLASDDTCKDHYLEWPEESTFCARSEWTISDHDANSAYARYDEDEDEWTVYFTLDTPEGHEEMGFYSCGQIPEDEHGEIRDLCYECR